jgi:hypothetical protein
MKRLITARARLLKRAFEEGYVKSGNHEIIVEGAVVTFKFHGTPITFWNLETGIILQDAGDFGDRISTANNQRKNEQAINEYWRYIDGKEA